MTDLWTDELRRTDQPALPVSADARQRPGQGTSEREVDQRDVVAGDVGAGVAPRDPFGELTPADRLRLEQRGVAVVDVPQHTIDDVRAELAARGITIEAVKQLLYIAPEKVE